jgi:hypothetical protein
MHPEITLSLAVLKKNFNLNYNMTFIRIVLFCFVVSLTTQGQILNKKNLTAYDGFFKFFYEKENDKIYLEVDSLKTEFLYINSLASGIGSNDIGLDRGKLGQERLVYFKKAGNKLLLIQPNLKYRANTKNDLERKSIEQAFAKSVLFGFKILSDTNGKYIIDFTPFLMQDTQGVAGVLKSKKEGSFKLDASKSALSLERTKAFPKNVEFEALLTFKGEPTGRNLRTVVPTSSLVTVIQHHSFVALPDSDYTPRKFDPRSGAIYTSYMDYAAPIQEPITKQFIIRHRLKKKNPNALMSEPEEPIIYYLDPGTPEPVRSALLDGASWWDQAFEAIGYSNAFQVKMLPVDADPMDCRYNVIQWVHRSTRGWSYGASVVDPRTGEIIKGHVSLGSLRVRQDYMIAQALMNKPFIESDGAYQPMLDMALARIRQLSAHEVGHTLGFTHNFAASTNGRSSVMDYPHPKLAFKNSQIDITQAYDVGIGEWDKITVAYSYSDFKDGVDENAELNAILEKAQDDGLRFITDSDARASGGAHLLAHLWDNGKTPYDELNEVLDVRQQAISNFSEDNIRSFETYSSLEDIFVPLYFYHRYQTEATTKVIGGLDYNYKLKDDGQFSVRPVNVQMQKNALEAVLNTINAKVLAIPKDKLELFPPRAYGNNRTRESFKGKTGVSFDPLSAASTASEFTISFLLHPQRVNRILLQKSLDDEQLGLAEVFNELVNASFKTSYKDDYLNEIQQQINVSVLNHLMNTALNEDAYFQVRSIALEAINTISGLLYDKKKPVLYADQYRYMINEFREHPKKFKLDSAPKIPDGSPIGGGLCTYNPN